MARKGFKPGTLTAPLPPVLATVGVGEKANMITIGWTGILSSTPPRTYISVRPERHSHSLLCEHGEFVINLTTEKMAWAVDYAGIYTGKKVDKWAKTGLTRAESQEVSVPTVAESPLALECRVFEVLHFGTHDVFMADIVAISADESIIEPDGRLSFERAGLLAYAHGEYFKLGESVGKFGFSAAKAKKATPQKADSGHKIEDKQKGEKKQPFYVTAPGYKRKGGKAKK